MKEAGMSTLQPIKALAIALVFVLGTSAPAIARPFKSKTQPTSAPTIVRVSAARGFEWGDAGIGAAGGFALSMIAVGGAMTLSQRRARRGPRSTA
jgi:hypothetical protein